MHSVTTLVDELLARGAQQVVVTDGLKVPGQVMGRMYGIAPSSQDRSWNTGAGDSLPSVCCLAFTAKIPWRSLAVWHSQCLERRQYVGPARGPLSSVALFKTLHRFRAISSRLIHSSPVYAGRR